MESQWDPGLYQSGHAFVWERGRGLVDLLAPAPGERILDAGCGTGQLTAEIAARGARVTGLDRSRAMLAEARRSFPHLPLVEGDIAALPFRAAFDAVFSNAALHWVAGAARAAASLAGALVRGGRFAAEFGGRGNVAHLIAAARAALEEAGVPGAAQVHPWYFPALGEYAALLERHGLEVTYAVLFDRLTPLEGGEKGLAGWFAMFGGAFTASLDEPARERLLRRVEELTAPALFHDGQWSADYRRLRVLAYKR